MSKAKEESKKKSEEKTQNKEEKLDNLKKEELILKYYEEKEQLKKKKEENLKESKILSDKIEENNNKLLDYSNKNKNLYLQLEDLRKDVDDKLDHVSLKKIAEKENANKLKNMPFKKNLDTIEKELNNVKDLIKILKKDNDNLNKKKNERSDKNKLLDLENNVKSLEKKNQDYINELKYLKSLQEEHKRCSDTVIKNELELKSLKEELYHLEKKEIELSEKINFEIKKRGETKLKLEDIRKSAVSQRNECEKMINGLNNSDKMKSLSSSKIILKKSKEEKKSSDNNYQPFFQHYDPIKEIDKNLKEKRLKNRKLFSKDDTTIHVKLPEINEKNDKTSYQSKYLSKSLATVRIDPDTEINKLFNEKERKLILKFCPLNEIERFEGLFNQVENKRVTAYKNYKNEMNESYSQLNQISDSIKMINLESKEVEQKNKLYTYQINEYKSEHSIQSKRINEAQEKLRALNQMLKEKENENYLLYSQVIRLKKLQELQEEKMAREIEKQMSKKIEKEEKVNESKSEEEKKDDE